MAVSHQQHQQERHHDTQRVQNQLPFPQFLELVHEDDGLGKVVQCVEQGNDFVALQNHALRLAESANGYLQGSQLQLPVQTALLTANAVHNVRNAVELLQQCRVPQLRGCLAPAGSLT
ncbi:Rrf2 family transcriptional regulator, putative [Babesia ovis]|uniref:Rrf2 family transcriptional regulator, putative n=1 Tax=Babesia ovis TaxID=5869 RepID=A0A9W5TDF0_BABOV|nr:Rrf2 family transcriptional regulator, putative [Babesia ovis]